MIVELKGEEVKKIGGMFRMRPNTLIDSCLDGCMGRAYADSRQRPTVALIEGGDFFFVAGDAVSKAAEELLMFLRQLARPVLLVVPEDTIWAARIRGIFGGAAVEVTRFSFKNEGDIFDHEKLRQYAVALPAGYAIRPVDAALLSEQPDNEVLRTLVQGFADEGAFFENGIGFAVTYDGEVVSGASSYAYYNGGIEVEIDTDAAHRRKGLATAVGAKLMLACLEAGKYPNWDAQNIESAMLATKLGYRLAGPYTTFFVQNKKPAGAGESGGGV